MSARLLNLTHVKRYTLDMREKVRPGWKADRVSADFLDRAEAHLKNWIVDQLNRSPSNGKTVR